MTTAATTTTAAFDADALATEAPELKIGGRLYVGRVLSIVEWSKYLDRFLAASEQELADFGTEGVVRSATMLANHDFCVEYLRAVVVIPEGAPDPVALLELQGERLLKQVFAHFFGHQCYVQGVALRTPTAAATSTPLPSQEPGSTSSGKTTPALDAAGASS
jgi:hypothetical protein